MTDNELKDAMDKAFSLPNPAVAAAAAAADFRATRRAFASAVREDEMGRVFRNKAKDEAKAAYNKVIAAGAEQSWASIMAEAEANDICLKAIAEAMAVRDKARAVYEQAKAVLDNAEAEVWAARSKADASLDKQNPIVIRRSRR